MKQKLSFFHIWRPISCICFIILIAIGFIILYKYTNIWNNHTSQNDDTIYDKTITFQAPSISDGTLGYKTQNTSFTSVHAKPCIIYEENKLTARLSTNNITYETEEKPSIENGLVKCTMTGHHFDDNNTNNIIYISEESYNNIYKPLQDAIYEYIAISGNDIMYSVELTYTDTQDHPDEIKVQGYSIDDTGNSCNFSYIIFTAKK